MYFLIVFGALSDKSGHAGILASNIGDRGRSNANIGRRKSYTSIIVVAMLIELVQV